MSPDDFDRKALYSRRAERVLLAGLLREPQLVTEECIERGVRGADLYFHAHQLVWDAAWSLVDSGLEPDLVSVYQTLRCRGQLADIDAANAGLWLAELYEADPTGAWCGFAAQVVKWYAERRHAIYRANEVLRDAYDGCRETEFYASRMT